MTWYWWLLVGILIGWLLSTLIEWLWFRRKRMEVRDERVAELESALRASGDAGASAGRVASASLTGAGGALTGMATPAAAHESILTAPDLDMPAVDLPDVDLPEMGLPDVDMPDVDLPDVDLPDVDLPEMGLPDVDLPDVDLPDVDLPEMGLPDVDMPDVDLPDMDMPDVDLPDVSAKPTGTETKLWAATLAAGAAAQDAAEDLSGELSGATTSLSDGAAVANTNYPDDLTEIKGIERVHETRLYRAGIYTWDQIAHMDVADLEQITAAIDAANAEDWPIQAQALAVVGDRVGARYDGPMPDKFSKLQGVGENAEQQLYRAGIFTYAQLAAATPGDLAAALPASRGDFEDWIAQAAASL